jgi:protein-S-isoprenylcysteine O-methyltransferase Ste14
MTIFNWLIIGCWLVFFAYWILSGLGAKKTIKSGRWGRATILRVGVVVLVMMFLNSSVGKPLLERVRHPVSSAVGSIVAASGVALCVAGIAFAIWARRHLGTNWGMPMSVKEHPELVTSGPYAVVRHPIYTGVLIAMLGSALVGGLPWLVLLLLSVGYFSYAARTEERRFLNEFPSEYPAYRARTKMLIPFVF